MRIAAYCRVSTGNEEQLDSLRNQRDFFIEYSREKGHELVCIYADEGITGTSLKKRTEFKRLMHDASKGRFDTVVVKDISRFARNTVDFLQGIRELKSYGINTVFVNSNMESFGESEFILTVFSAFAQEESVNISKRVKFGKKISAQKGCVPHSVFGYERIDNYTLSINPIEAQTVKKVYHMYVEEGIGCRKISTLLNKDGNKTKNGGEWSPKGVLRLLKNSIYCGEYVNSKYEVIDCINKKIATLPPEKNIMHNRPEWAIVTKEEFEKAQKILNSRNGHSAQESKDVSPGHSERYMFSCLIKCEECGRSFTRKKYSCRKERIYWKCPTNDQFTSEKCPNNTTLDEDDLIEKIREIIELEIGDEDRFIDEILCERYSKLRRMESEEKINSKIREIMQKRAKYMEIFASGIIKLDELKMLIGKLDKTVLALREKHEIVSKRTKFIYGRTDTVKECVNSFLNLENVTNSEMRKIIKYIGVNSEGYVKIHLA